MTWTGVTMHTHVRYKISIKQHTLGTVHTIKLCLHNNEKLNED